MNPAIFTGCVLAGGLSRRFGSYKGAHPINGRPMIAHVLAALKTTCERVLVSAGKAGPVPGLEPFDRVDIVVDRVAGAGPLAGVDAALASMETPWAVVVACDMPYVTSAAIRALQIEARGSVQAVVATDSLGRTQPLLACYNASIGSIATALLTAGEFSVYGLLDQLDRVIPVRLDDAVLRNINEKRDLS